MQIEFFFIIFLGLLFDYTNGFHDVANVVATSIATKILQPLRAILLAAALNFLGATQVSAVAQTMMTGLVHPTAISTNVILSSLTGAVFWNFLTWYYKIPSSSSYAVVGGLIGATWVKRGKEAIFLFSLLMKVLLPMILAPLVGCLLSFIIMRLSLRFIDSTHKVFRYLQVGSASLIAFSHGVNDAQKSMGIITLGLVTIGWLDHLLIPNWVILACAVMMAFGTIFGGFRIIKTVGFKVTHLKPLQGFVAECNASCTILLASFLGVPLSSTQIIMGSITGVGIAKGKEAVNWRTIRKTLLMWLLTLPGAAFVSGILAWVF